MLGKKFQCFLLEDHKLIRTRLKEEKGGYITPYNTTDNGAEYDKILNEFFQRNGCNL